VVEASVPNSSTIVDATALTVIASVVLHELTAGVLTERYTRGLRRRPPQTGIEAATTRVRVPAGGVRWP